MKIVAGEMGGTTQRAWNSRTAGGATLLLALMLVSAVRAASVEKGFSRSSFTEHRIDTLYRRDYAAPVSMPNWLALVPGSGVGLLPSYMAAPAGLEFVVRASDPSARTFSTATSGAIADVAFSRWHAVLGYCEAGSTPCTLANTDRVLGCCPAGQVCGYNRGTGTFIGCLDSIGQECYGRRCNPGYVCCPARDGGKSQCVPDLGSVDASCGTATVYEERRASGKKGEVLAAAVGKSRGYKSYDRVKPAGYNGTITTYEGVNVTADAALGVFRCPPLASLVPHGRRVRGVQHHAHRGRPVQRHHPRRRLHGDVLRRLLSNQLDRLLLAQRCRRNASQRIARLIHARGGLRGHRRRRSLLRRCHLPGQQPVLHGAGRQHRRSLRAFNLLFGVGPMLLVGDARHLLRKNGGRPSVRRRFQGTSLVVPPRGRAGRRSGFLDEEAQVYPPPPPPPRSLSWAPL